MFLFKEGGVEPGTPGKVTPPDSDVGITNENAVHKQDFTAGDGLYARLQRFAGKFGIEQRGIERVPNDERRDSSMSQISTVWLSSNMVVSTFAVGALAIPIFGLGFVDAALTILFMNVLAIIPVSFFSTFGPRFGLRQVILSRFYFGYYGVKFIALFNIIASIGWSSVNVIVGAQLFNAVNRNMPGWAGILVIATSVMIICMFGYRIVHAYEKCAWIPCFVIFLIVLGEFAHSGEFNSRLPLGRGPGEAGSVLSFAASVYGFATGWCTLAADYTVYQPADRHPVSVFCWTFAGLFFPIIFTELLGAAVMTATLTNVAYRDAYFESGIGGLLASVLVPRLGRFGDFCLVVLALSIIANNCPNIYSLSMSLQVLAKETQCVPRFVWVFVSTCVYVAISIPGYDHFEAWLENFMLITGYWSAVYEGIALTEHFIFRRGFGGYKPEDYTKPTRLPPGLAAMVAFGFGVLGAVLGMAQVWFTGPIGKLCGGPLGGDVGFELAFGFSMVSYLGLRAIEKGHFGR